MNCKDIFWKGCYSGSFDLISPDSFAHPAKMAPSLCYRIIEHLEELGLLKAGMTILDPMSGTGLTAICANAKGYRAVTIELEPKFIGFQQQNKEYAARKLGKPLDWTILQGDSRKLSELLSEHCVTVTSPPYGDIRICTTERMGIEASGKRTTERKYGETEGNLGNSGESYLRAMRLVYQQIALVSDVCVVVTKNPTRAGKLRKLDLDTIALLKDCGYEILCHHKALLFTESEHHDLFGTTHKKVKGRMSFFKRLSYQKGNAVAQWEDVIFAVKNGGAAW